MEDCPICCESYTKLARAKITCTSESCQYAACKLCIRQYLLTTTKDPHCMSCKKAWDHKFTIKHFNKSWVDKDYKKHRKQLLLERQLAQMPATMNEANNQIEARKFDKEILEVDAKRKILKQQLKELEREKYTIQHKKRQLLIGKSGHEKKKFIMACPHETCRGFLSTNYKCGICEQYTCSKCMEVVGEHALLEYHVCDENSVKSAELIKKETRPCPGCGERIYKIEGCDQMWCTTCHVAFSWSTGKRDTGQVHNPHFFEHVNQNGHMIRNPGDQVCGGLPQWWTMQENVRTMFQLQPDIWRQEFIKQDKAKYEILLQEHNKHPVNTRRYSMLFKWCCHVFRILSEFSRLHLDATRQSLIRYDDTLQLRVSYILKDIDQNELATKLIRNDKLRKKYTDILHIYELLFAVGIDTFRYLDDTSKQVRESFEAREFKDVVSEVIDKFLELERIKEYCNTELKKISELYSNQVIQFGRFWRIERKKFNKSDIKSMSS